MTPPVPITDHDSTLAIELAVGISAIPDILKRHGMTAPELKNKLRDPHFKNMVKEAKRTWLSDLTVKDRIRLKSQVLIEDNLLELHSIFNDGDNALPSRLDAFGKMAKLADVDSANSHSGGTGAGGGVHIQLNFGSRRPLVIDAEELHTGDVELSDDSGVPERVFGSVKGVGRLGRNKELGESLGGED